MKVCKKCGTPYVLCNFGVPHEVQLCDCEDPQEEEIDLLQAIKDYKALEN